MSSMSSVSQVGLMKMMSSDPFSWHSRLFCFIRPYIVVHACVFQLLCNGKGSTKRESKMNLLVYGSIVYVVVFVSVVSCRHLQRKKKEIWCICRLYIHHVTTFFMFDVLM